MINKSFTDNDTVTLDFDIVDVQFHIPQHKDGHIHDVLLFLADYQSNVY